MAGSWSAPMPIFPAWTCPASISWGCRGSGGVFRRLLVTGRGPGNRQFRRESGGKVPIRGDLTGASLTKADLDYARLDGANLPTANLMRTSLIEASLVGACFDKADLSGANLSAADLTAASLAGAVLRSTHLVGARPPGADGTGNQHRHRQPDRRCSPRNWFLSACGLAVPAAE